MSAALARLRVVRQFRNFEARGDAFRELVLALPGGAAMGEWL